MTAEPMVAAPVASDRTEETLRRYLQRAQAAELALKRAQEALGDADFLIEAIRELVNVFPEGNQNGGTLGDLARKLGWLEEERSRIAGRTHRRAHLTVPALAAALGPPWNQKKLYRWLPAGRIPGASQPGGPGTEWLIPADAAERMLAQNKGKEE